MQSQDLNLSTVTLAEVVAKSHQFYIKGSLTGKTSVFLVVGTHGPSGPWRSDGPPTPSLLVVAKCLAWTSEVPHGTVIDSMTESTAK